MVFTNPSSLMFIWMFSFQWRMVLRAQISLQYIRMKKSFPEGVISLQQIVKGPAARSCVAKGLFESGFIPVHNNKLWGIVIYWNTTLLHQLLWPDLWYWALLRRSGAWSQLFKIKRPVVILDDNKSKSSQKSKIQRQKGIINSTIVDKSCYNTFKSTENFSTYRCSSQTSLFYW